MKTFILILITGVMLFGCGDKTGFPDKLIYPIKPGDEQWKNSKGILETYMYAFPDSDKLAKCKLAINQHSENEYAICFYVPTEDKSTFKKVADGTVVPGYGIPTYWSIQVPGVKNLSAFRSKDKDGKYLYTYLYRGKIYQTDKEKSD